MSLSIRVSDAGGMWLSVGAGQAMNDKGYLVRAARRREVRRTLVNMMLAMSGDFVPVEVN